MDVEGEIEQGLRRRIYTVKPTKNCWNHGDAQESSKSKVSLDLLDGDTIWQLPLN